MAYVQIGFCIQNLFHIELSEHPKDGLCYLLFDSEHDAK